MCYIVYSQMTCKCINHKCVKNIRLKDVILLIYYDYSVCQLLCFWFVSIKSECWCWTIFNIATDIIFWVRVCYVMLCEMLSRLSCMVQRIKCYIFYTEMYWITRYWRITKYCFLCTLKKINDQWRIRWPFFCCLCSLPFSCSAPNLLWVKINMKYDWTT